MLKKNIERMFCLILLYDSKVFELA